MTQKLCIIQPQKQTNKRTIKKILPDMWEIPEEHLPWVFLAFFSVFLHLILKGVISLPPNIRLSLNFGYLRSWGALISSTLILILCYRMVSSLTLHLYFPLESHWSEILLSAKCFQN